MVRTDVGDRMTVAVSARDRLMAWPRTDKRATAPISLQMTRASLPSLCREFGFTKGAEIGVWKGAYAAAFCTQNPAMHMLCVDPWLSYPAWLDTKNEMPAEQAARFMEQSYRIARETLDPLHCTIMREFSVDAAASVPDESLDLVYIDANHVFDAVLEDLTFWVPKVRPGGIVAGHDFRHFQNKPTIHVIEAVREYVKDHAIDPWFITAADRTPSFLWVVN